MEACQRLISLKLPRTPMEVVLGMNNIDFPEIKDYHSRTSVCNTPVMHNLGSRKTINELKN